MIDVVFSSFNGERTVGVTLDACCRLVTPAGGWKLIAVDNGSTDNTANIMHSFAARLPLQILTVATRGKNNAINAALEFVQGDLVVLTDDDVVPEPQWLCELERCALLHPEYVLFGGPILPRWPQHPAEWILSSVPLGMVYAVTDPARNSGEVEHTLVWGPNMAVRRCVFDTGIRFNGAVGPDGTAHYAMGSETEFTRRLRQSGFKAWFCADARVEHIVRDHQLCRRWILQRFFRKGRSDYLLDYKPDRNRHAIFGVDRWIYRKLVVSLFRAIGFWLIGKSNEALLALSEFHDARGNLYQARSMHGKDADWRNRN